MRRQHPPDVLALKGLKTSQTTFVTPGIVALWEMPRDPVVQQRSPPAAPNLPLQESSFPVSSVGGSSSSMPMSQASLGPSMEFCGAFCRCADCRAKEAAIKVPDSQGSVASASSVAALALQESVPAGKGEPKALAESNAEAISVAAQE